MFINILKAEFYKQYSKKTSFIIPGIIFLLFIIMSYLYLSSMEAMTNIRNVEELVPLITRIYLVTIATVLLTIYISFIMPIITPISIYGQDYNNNVISNTIALGGERTHIFLSKLIVSITHCLLYYLCASIGLIIGVSTFFLISPYDLSEFFENTRIEIDWAFLIHALSNSAMTLFSTMSIAILAITLTKNFVGAFFTSLGFHFVGYFIPIMIIMNSVLLTLEFYTGQEVTAHEYFLISNIYMVLVSSGLLALSLLKFIKTEY